MEAPERALDTYYTLTMQQESSSMALLNGLGNGSLSTFILFLELKKKKKSKDSRESLKTTHLRNDRMRIYGGLLIS